MRERLATHSGTRMREALRLACAGATGAVLSAVVTAFVVAPPQVIAAVAAPTPPAASASTPIASTHVPRGKPADFAWVPLPEFGGAEAIIYRSPDGRRVAAAFRESGTATFTYPFDELLVVTSGHVRMRVHGGETFTLETGDVAYLREGLTVDMQFSPDFSDVTCLMSDREVKWR